MERILHVFGQVNRGGAETRTMDIYRKLDRKKYQFDFLCFGEEKRYDYSDEIESLGGRLLFVKSGLPFQIFEMVKVMRQEGPFLAVHSHVSHYSAFVMTAAKMAGIKGRIVHSRTSSDDNITGARKIYFVLSSILIRLFGNVFLACGVNAGNYLFGSAPLFRKSFTVIPNAIAIDEYRAVENDKAELRRKVGLPDSSIVIGHVGRLEEVKNHCFLLRIFHEFHKKNSNSILVCAGEGTLRECLEKRVKEMELEGSVFFLGLRNDIPFIMHTFDIFVMPSFYEGIPGVVIEAQAADIPCLLSDTISKEVDIGTGLVRFAALEEDPVIWGERIGDMLAGEYVTKEESIRLLEEHGYSVNASVEKMESIYAHIREEL